VVKHHPQIVSAVAALGAAFLLVPNAPAQPRLPSLHQLVRHADGHPHHCDIRRPHIWSPLQLKCVIRIVFPRREWHNADRIVGCESEWDERNVSPTSDYGLFQINRPSHPDAFVRGYRRMFDPVVNSRYARRMQSRAGWRPWVCARLLGIA
jgi:hypothetical protein